MTCYTIFIIFVREMIRDLRQYDMLVGTTDRGICTKEGLIPISEERK